MVDLPPNTREITQLEFERWNDCLELDYVLEQAEYVYKIELEVAAHLDRQGMITSGDEYLGQLLCQPSNNGFFVWFNRLAPHGTMVPVAEFTHESFRNKE